MGNDMGGRADRRKRRLRAGFPDSHTRIRRIPNCADASRLVWSTRGKRTDLPTISPFRFGRSRARSWGCCRGAYAEQTRFVVDAAQPVCPCSRSDNGRGESFPFRLSGQKTVAVRLAPDYRRSHRRRRAVVLPGSDGPRAACPGRSPGRPSCDPARARETNPLRPPDPHRVEVGGNGRFRPVPKFRRSAAEWRIVVTATFSRLTAPVEEFESHEQE
jgi:hypothetical protein